MRDWLHGGSPGVAGAGSHRLQLRHLQLLGSWASLGDGLGSKEAGSWSRAWLPVFFFFFFFFSTVFGPRSTQMGVLSPICFSGPSSTGASLGLPASLQVLEAGIEVPWVAESINRATWRPRETMGFGWYLQGSRVIPGFLGWREMEFATIHSSAC